MWLEPGVNVAADFFLPLSAPELDQLRLTGVQAVGRYSKKLWATDVKATHDAGLGLFVIVEGTGTDWQGGAPVGKTLALQAEAALTVLGYPKSAALVLAYQDTYVAPIETNHQLMSEFTAAFWSNLSPRTGPRLGYGARDIGYRLVDNGLINGVVEAGATSWSSIPRDARTWMVQHPSSAAPAPFSGRIDLNDVIMRFPVWSREEGANDMRLIRDTRTGSIALADIAYRRHLATIDEANGWAAVLGPWVDVTPAVWDGLIDWTPPVAPGQPAPIDPTALVVALKAAGVVVFH